MARRRAAPPAGGRGADAGHAGDIVHRVAHQGLQLDQLARRNAPFLHHLGRPDRLLLHRVQHGDAGPDELHQVLVRGDDRGAVPHGLGGQRIGGDQIVRFPVGQLDGGDAEGGGGIAHQGELRAQFLGRLRALGLVALVQAVAERVPAGVEYHGKVIFGMVFQQPDEHVGEAEHGVHGGAVRPSHRGQGVKGTKNEA